MYALATTKHSTPTMSDVWFNYYQIIQRDDDLVGRVWLFQARIGNGVPVYVTAVQNVTWNKVRYGFKFAAIYIAPSATSPVQGNFGLTMFQVTTSTSNLIRRT